MFFSSFVGSRKGYMCKFWVRSQSVNCNVLHFLFVDLPTGTLYRAEDVRKYKQQCNRHTKLPGQYHFAPQDTATVFDKVSSIVYNTHTHTYIQTNRHLHSRSKSKRPEFTCGSLFSFQKLYYAIMGMYCWFVPVDRLDLPFMGLCTSFSPLLSFSLSLSLVHFCHHVHLFIQIHIHNNHTPNRMHTSTIPPTLPPSPLSHHKDCCL